MDMFQSEYSVKMSLHLPHLFCYLAGGWAVSVWENVVVARSQLGEMQGYRLKDGVFGLMTVLMSNFSAWKKRCVIDGETVAWEEEGHTVNEGHSWELERFSQQAVLLHVLELPSAILKSDTGRAL